MRGTARSPAGWGSSSACACSRSSARRMPRAPRRARPSLLRRRRGTVADMSGRIALALGLLALLAGSAAAQAPPPPPAATGGAIQGLERLSPEDRAVAERNLER